MILIVDPKSWTLFSLPTLKPAKRGSSLKRLPNNEVTTVGLVVESLGSSPILKLSEETKANLAESEQKIAESLLRSFKKRPIWLISDTFFFRSLPIASSAYLLPTEDKRIGVNGLIHYNLLSQASARLGRSLLDLNVITAYLDEQSSVAAIKNGAAIEISSGRGVLDGLPGATSSGSIDGDLLIDLVEKVGAKRARQFLSQEAGLLGFSGFKKNLDEVLSSSKLRQNPKFTLALKIYIHRLLLTMGAFAALLGRVDGVVFSGSLGTKSSFIRESLTDSLGIFRSVNILNFEAEPHQAAAELINRQG